MQRPSLCAFLTFFVGIVGLFSSCMAGQSSSLPEASSPTPTYVYLTIDDGPLGGIQETLEVIGQIKTPVSMMIVGAHVESSEAHKLSLQKAKANPLVLIGNHSYTHANDRYEHYYQDPEEVLRDFEKNQHILGVEWKIARLPGRNMWEVGARHLYDIKSGQTSAKLLKKNGYTVFGWDIEWEHDSRTGEPIESVEFLLKENEQKISKSFTPGHVVILAHDEMFRSLEEGSALSKLLTAVEKKGYIFKTLKDYPLN